MSSSIEDRLRAGPVLGAEGYVFELERRGYIKAGPFVPEVVTLAPTQPDQTRDGYGYAEACRILAAEGAQVVGLNCDRGPQTMLPLIAGIREAVECAVAFQPVRT